MNETVGSILERKGSTIWFVAPDASVYEAIELMAAQSVGAVLVISERRLEGIISERDYARKVILQGRSSKDTLVRDIMTRDLITVTPEDTVDECMRLVTHHRIRHLPVLERGELAGIISIGDLVNTIIAGQAEVIGHLHTYIGSDYPR